MSLFSEKLIKGALKIPKGKVTTYGKLANHAGKTGQAARSVSFILSRSSQAEKIPFHRIVYSNGKVFCSSNKSFEKKRIKMLQEEGLEIKNGKIQNLEKYLYQF